MLFMVKSKFASVRPFKLKNRKIIVMIINGSMNLKNKNCAKYTLHRPMGHDSLNKIIFKLHTGTFIFHLNIKYFKIA